MSISLDDEIRMLSSDLNKDLLEIIDQYTEKSALLTGIIGIPNSIKYFIYALYMNKNYLAEKLEKCMIGSYASALIFAVEKEYIHVIKLLLSSGYEYSVYEYDNSLKAAISNGGNIEIVKIILSSPYSPKYSPPNYYYAGMLAVRFGYIEIVKLLSSYLKYNYYESALECAAKNGHLDVIILFIYCIQDGVSVNTSILKDVYNSTLIYAAEYGHLHIVEYMINKGYATDSSTALLGAKKYNRQSIIDFLSENSIMIQR